MNGGAGKSETRSQSHALQQTNKLLAEVIAQLRLNSADRAGPLQSGRVLLVRNIGLAACKTEEALRRALAPYGDVVSATIRHKKHEDGTDASWALVTMDSLPAAESALHGVVKAGPNQTELQVGTVGGRVSISSTRENLKSLPII